MRKLQAALALSIDLTPILSFSEAMCSRAREVGKSSTKPYCFYNVFAPDDYGAESQVRAQFQFMFPK